MNTVNIKRPARPAVEFKAGSLWRDGTNGPIYILAQVKCGVFAAINLEDGNRWNNPQRDPVTAVSGLNLVAQEAVISIGIKGKG